MYSWLYQTLTDGELARVVEHALGTALVESRLLTGGLFNTTYFIRTAGCGDAVLRVGPVNRERLMPFEHHLMDAEDIVYRLCAEHGVPASEVLALDLTRQAIDRDFMIVRYIPSRALSETPLSAEDKPRIHRDAGAATRRMHSITQPRFGRIHEVCRGGGFDRWSDCLLDELADWETVAVPTGMFTPDEHRRLREIYRDHAALLDEITVPALVHTDLWEGNILVSNDTPRPEFAAIIDADRALFGDPEFEFSVYRWSVNPDFMSGYGPRPPYNPDRMRLYELLTRLWNAYVYRKQYDEPDRLQNELAAIRRLLQSGGSAASQ